MLLPSFSRAEPVVCSVETKGRNTKIKYYTYSSNVICLHIMDDKTADHLHLVSALGGGIAQQTRRPGIFQVIK